MLLHTSCESTGSIHKHLAVMEKLDNGMALVIMNVTVRRCVALMLNEEFMNYFVPILGRV